MYGDRPASLFRLAFVETRRYADQTESVVSQHSYLPDYFINNSFILTSNLTKYRILNPPFFPACLFILHQISSLRSQENQDNHSKCSAANLPP